MGSEPPDDLIANANWLVYGFGFRRKVANLLQYFYTTGLEWNYDTTKITNEEASALVEQAQAYNRRLYAQEPMENIFEEDMAALQSIERNYSFRERIFIVLGKESGAFIMRLHDHFRKEFTTMYDICSVLYPERRESLEILRVTASTMEIQEKLQYFQFAKYYSHWYDKELV